MNWGSQTYKEKFYKFQVKHTTECTFRSTDSMLENNNRLVFTFLFPVPFNLTVNHAMCHYYEFKTTYM